MSDDNDLDQADRLAKLLEHAAGPDLDEFANSSLDQADSTVKGLKVELDTLATKLAQPAPVDPYRDESALQRGLALVEAIGREPSFVGESSAGSEVEEDLGSLRDYKLLSKLGQGGMGTVYKALHTKLDKIVALKVLPADKLRDDHAVSRFEREMKAVGRLEHPNIVRATDAGEVDGKHFLVMEHVAGLDLSTIVHSLGPFPVANACEIIRQTAIGLQHAHEHGLVHRDIKPSNIMLSKVEGRELRVESQKQSASNSGPQLSTLDPRLPGSRPSTLDSQPSVKILDMGLALLEENRLAEQRDLTTTGQMMGTLDYMAPEQGLDSHEVDTRADIYSLGATLFKLLTGETPFPSKKYGTPMKMLMALANESARSIATVRADLPSELAEVVDRMLRKSPDERFANPQEVAMALEPFTAGCNLGALLSRAEQNDRDDTSLARTNEYLSAPSTETKADAKAPDKAKGAQTHRFEITQLAKALPSSSAWYQRPAIIAAVALSAIGFVAAAVIISIMTDKGELIVRSNDDKVQVAVRRHNGEPVEDIELTKGQGQTTLRSGKYEVIITGDNADQFTIDPNIVTLSRGNEAVVTIERKAMEAVETKNFALQFDGQSGYVEVPTFPREPTSEPPFTIEAWVQSSRMYKREQEAGYILYSRSYGNIRQSNVTIADNWVGGRLNGDRNSLSQVSVDAVQLYETEHVASIWTGETIRLYINGAEQLGVNHTIGYPKGFPTSHISLLIGCAWSPADEQVERHLFQGIIDEVRISNTARYTEDFTPAKRFEPDEHTVGLYHFDEGSGDVLKDSSGNNHHGKIVGAKWVKADLITGPSKEPSERAKSLDQQIAEWVLSIGGKVTCLASKKELKVAKATDLPSGPYQLIGVALGASTNFAADDLARLPELKLTSFACVSRAFNDECLAHVGKIRSLKNLALSGTSVSDDGMAHLRGIEVLSNLDLNFTPITDRGLETVVRSINAKGYFYYLYLSGTKITNRGLRHLKSLTGLLEIHLDDDRITDDGLRHFTEVPSLRIIRLTNTAVTDAALGQFQQCPNLMELHLGRTLITDAGLMPLKDVPKLKHLFAESTRITDAGVSEFSKIKAGCKVVNNLSPGQFRRDEDRFVADWVLRLGGRLRVAATGGVIIGVASRETLPDKDFRVVSIALDNNEEVRDLDLELFANLPDLQDLSLDKTSVSDIGMVYLAGLPGLKTLNVAETSVTKDGIGAIHKAFPKCEVNAD
jgi:serine/threonine protein kinase